MIQLRNRAPQNPPHGWQCPLGGHSWQAGAAGASVLPCPACWPTAPLRAARGERVRGCWALRWLLQKAASSPLPPDPKQTKGAPHPLHGLCLFTSPGPLWPAFWLSSSWAREPHAHGPHQRNCFQECFLGRATCFAGLQSRWPEPLGARASSPEAGAASVACGPGEAPAHNSPVTAPTSHLLHSADLCPTERMAN